MNKGISRQKWLIGPNPTDRCKLASNKTSPRINNWWTSYPIICCCCYNCS